jgi:hypothetical protein
MNWLSRMMGIGPAVLVLIAVPQLDWHIFSIENILFTARLFFSFLPSFDLLVARNVYKCHACLWFALNQSVNALRRGTGGSTQIRTFQ